MNAINPGTVFSKDRKYRYTLWRDWIDDYGFFNQPEHPQSFANFICLNPSTADESEDDPTIRRCIAYAKAWGYPAFYMIANEIDDLLAVRDMLYGRGHLRMDSATKQGEKMDKTLEYMRYAREVGRLEPINVD